jgi:ribosomal protein S18 acetylase RimI-like enzyme
VSGDLQIGRVGAERIDDFEPLYRALHDHHIGIAPALGGAPGRTVEESWERRRRRYEEWLARPGAFAVIAERGGDAVGFAVVTVEAGFDSWNSGEETGEVRDIAVAEGARGDGLGSRLLARVASELVEAKVDFYRLRVLGGNEGAVRFYERAGLATVTTEMLGPTGTAGPAGPTA